MMTLNGRWAAVVSLLLLTVGLALSFVLNDADAAATAPREPRQVSFQVRFRNGLVWEADQHGFICIPTDLLLTPTGPGHEQLTVITNVGNHVRVTLSPPLLNFTGQPGLTNIEVETTQEETDFFLESDMPGMTTLNVRVQNPDRTATADNDFNHTNFVLTTDWRDIQVAPGAALGQGTPNVPPDQNDFTVNLTAGFVGGQPNLLGNLGRWPTRNPLVDLRNPSHASFGVTLSTSTQGAFRIQTDPADDTATAKQIKCDITVSTGPTHRRVVVHAIGFGAFAEWRWTSLHTSNVPGITLPSRPAVTFEAQRSERIRRPDPPDRKAPPDQTFNDEATASDVVFAIGSTEFNYKVSDEVFASVRTNLATSQGEVRHGANQGVRVEMRPKCPDGFLE